MSPSGLRVTGPSPIPSVNNSVWPSDSDGQKLCRRGVEDRVEEVAAVAGGEIVFTAMDSATLAASATLALCALLALLVWMRGRRAVPLKKEQRRRVQGQQEPAAGPQVIAGARGRRQGARMRRAAATASNDVEQEEEAAAAAAEEREELEQAGVKVPEGKIGKKKLEKLQAKADRKLAREADEREREEAKKKREQREEEESKKKEREEEEEKRQKEAERLAREEKERREHEEYLKMKEAFQVEEEGFDEDGDAGDDQENKLKQFVDYIKASRTPSVKSCCLSSSLDCFSLLI